MFSKVSLILATVAKLACSAGYGPVSPVKDMTTGLELLALPEGFSYMSYGTKSDIVSATPNILLTITD